MNPSIMSNHIDQEKPKALVLGGTYPHIQLIKNLSKRGYKTILIDYHEAPCAKPFSDLHIQASTLDLDRVLEIAKKERVSLVISSCIDQANLIACTVAEELDLPRPYDHEKGKIVTNKILMKGFMKDHGIPSSPFAAVRSNKEYDVSSLNYPLIVKPSDSNSSKGVIKVTLPNQLKESVETATRLSRSNEAIIEEFVEGREVGFDFYINEGHPELLITKERRKIPTSVGSAQQIYGCFWPANLTEKETTSSIEIARNIAKSLGITNSPLMIQAIVGDNGISVIEFAARFGGGESFKIIELATGVDIIDLSIRSFLGESAVIHLNASKNLYAETFIYTNACEFNHIKIKKPTMMKGTIDHIHEYKTPGMQIDNNLTSNNRVGCFIVSGKDIAELRRKIKIALNGIEVIDMSGHEVFRREIYRLEK